MTAAQPFATLTGTRSTLQALSAAGWGALVTPDSYAPGRVAFAVDHGMPLALDNGAFASWIRGEDWHATQRDRFEARVVELGGLVDWIVAPDIVAGGLASLELSEAWIPWLLDHTRIVLLPVQDGMEPEDVAPILARYHPRVGIFLGGSTEWKWETADQWGELADTWGVPYHVARVNSMSAIRRAGTVGATSWDGTGPVQFPSMLERLERGHRQQTMALLDAPAPCCARPDLIEDPTGVWCVECGEQSAPGIVTYASIFPDVERQAELGARRARRNPEQLALFAVEGWRAMAPGQKYQSARWYTGAHDSLDDGYLLMIRSPEDPQRRPRPKGGQEDRQPHLTIARRSRADLEAEILGHLSRDAYPKTLNRIGVELWDKTADITAGTKAGDALLALVDRGEVAWGIFSAPGDPEAEGAIYFVKNQHPAPSGAAVWVDDASRNPPDQLTMFDAIGSVSVQPSKPTSSQEKIEQWKAEGDGRTLFERFGHMSAPAEGRKGYRPPPEIPAGALDGRDPYEVAATAVAAAHWLNDDPDLFTMIDPHWMEEWVGYMPEHDDDERQELVELAELADYMRIPTTGVRGRRASQQERSDFAHWLLHRVAEQRAGTYAGPLSQALKHDPDGWSVPDWVIIGSVVDQLTVDPGKARLVPVSKAEAYDFVKRHHSKLGAGFKLPPGLIYAIGVRKGHRLVAVALVNHPTAQWRRTDPRNVLELTRIASDGTVKNAASMLAARAIDLLPLSKRGDPDKPGLFVTYSFAGEPGTPYKALRQKGLRPTARVRGGAAHGARAGGAGRSELDKIRWEAGPAAMPADWTLLAEQVSIPELQSRKSEILAERDEINEWKRALRKGQGAHDDHYIREMDDIKRQLQALKKQYDEIDDELTIAQGGAPKSRPPMHWLGLER